jgi:hypothetical protein
MELHKSITGQFLFMTTRMEVKKKSGAVGTGTAFFYAFKTPNGATLPALITNKHVIEDGLDAVLSLHRKDAKGNPDTPITLNFKNAFQHHWTMHPDKNVDLCAFPAKILDKIASDNGSSLFYICMSDEMAATQAFLEKCQAVEDLMMVGYPIGLWDNKYNYPVIRKGVTASHPAVDFKGMPEGLVDMACFPGSSGSPIFICNIGSYMEDNSLIAGSRCRMIGVLYGGPQYTAKGELVVTNIATSVVAQSYIPCHLGQYIKVSAFTALKDEMIKNLK